VHIGPLPWRFVRRFAYPAATFMLVMAAGTVGYSIIGGPQTSTLDALYMTFITVATIGYHEVIDLSHSPGGRVFTMFIAAAGILNFSYMMAVLTAFIVEVDINQALRRRRMQKQIEKLEGHYIVCGIGRVGSNVVEELDATGRAYVTIDVDPAKLRQHCDRHPEGLIVQGDAGEDDVLNRAGLPRAAGVFAITGDDSKNLVITLSAKQLNPGVRVVARCHEVNFVEKIRRVGADDIVSPDFTGGMRIASSMIRPNVVGFLDEMLRADRALRVEEVTVPVIFPETTFGQLGLRSAEYVVLAVRKGAQWRFNPQTEHSLKGGDVLVIMATPNGRSQLEGRLAA
jgi:voltage-gated potassium channel